MPPPYKITRGQSLGLLPFGNIAVTMTMNGAELKTMLENGVSRSVSTDAATLNQPSAQGRFPQVSGLCFTWTPNKPRVAGSPRWSARMRPATARRRRRLDRCHELHDRPERLHRDRWRRLPELRQPDGDQEILEELLADYVTANSPLNPFVNAAPNGRINCDDTNGAALPNCPALTPSPPSP